MKSFGGTPRGQRLERIKASPRWAGERFRNVHPIIPGLRDPNASMPTIREFLCDGERRTPRRPLPSMNPLETWTRPPASGLRATWLGHSTVLIEIDGLACSPIRSGDGAHRPHRSPAPSASSRCPFPFARCRR